MADNRLQPNKHPAPAPTRDRVAPQRASRPSRPDPETIASLVAEAERIMGVKPLIDGPSRPLPGY